MWYSGYASANLARNAELVLNLATGPGELEGIVLAIDDNSATTPFLNVFKIVVDGADAYSAYVDGFIGSWNVPNLSGPLFSSAAATAAQKTIMQWKGKIPYQATLAIKVTNTASPDHANFIVSSPHRVFR